MAEEILRTPGTTMLHLAACLGIISLVPRLLALGQEINAKDDKYQTPLHYAAQGGWVKSIHVLLSENAHSSISLFEQTPIDLAVTKGKYENVEILLGAQQRWI